MPWARPPTARSSSTGAPTTGCRARPRSARHPGWRPCSTTRRVRAWVTGGGNRHLSVPRGLMPVVARAAPPGQPRRRVGLDVDPRRATGAPAVEERVAALDPADRDEMVELPRGAQPAHPRPAVRAARAALGRGARRRRVARGRWAAASRAQSGIPTLAGIAVDLRRRGEGWGAAVTAHLTRLAVARSGACALGMFADNDVARAALPPAGLHDRNGVDLALVRRLTCA